MENKNVIVVLQIPPDPGRQLTWTSPVAPAVAVERSQTLPVGCSAVQCSAVQCSAVQCDVAPRPGNGDKRLEMETPGFIRQISLGDTQPAAPDGNPVNTN